MTELKPSVVFKVMGGSKIGMGHVMRSLELARDLQNEGFDVGFICNSDKNCLSVINAAGFEIILSGDDLNKILEIVFHKGPDILIFDQLEEVSDLSSLLKKNSDIMIVALDYCNYSNNDVDIIINLFNHNLEEDPRSREGYYEGLEYAIIRDSFRQYIQSKKVIRNDVVDILVTMGGADIGLNTIKTLDLLEKDQQSYNINIIIGPAFKNKESIFEKVKNKENYKIYQNLKDISKHIFLSDICFVNGGTTLMESCSIGTPVIVIPQNSLEEKFVEQFTKEKAALVFSDNLSADKKLSLFHKLKDVKTREQMSRNQKKLIDGKGKGRIIKIIMENYMRGKL